MTPGLAESLDALLRLAVAALAGAILGLPVSVRHRVGGLHTQALVAMGATLFCLTAARHVPEETGRIVAGIISGIGFVGAAAVLKRGAVVSGVATAASVWLAGAVGCEVGLGNPFFAVVLATVASVLNQTLIFFKARTLRRIDEREAAKGPRKKD